MAAPYTRTDAEKDGYRLVAKGEQGSAYDDTGQLVLSTTSRIPLFSMLLTLADMQGKGFAEGYGGSLEITPELVKQVSGEKYKPDPDEPEPETPAEAVARIMVDPQLTQDEKNAELAAWLRDHA